jgi:hypothetical protein
MKDYAVIGTEAIDDVDYALQGIRHESYCFDICTP